MGNSEASRTFWSDIMSPPDLDDWINLLDSDGRIDTKEEHERILSFLKELREARQTIKNLKRQGRFIEGKAAEDFRKNTGLMGDEQ